MEDDNDSSPCSELKDGLDSSSRYYFHHSDNSAISLSSQLLNGGNWVTWSKSVEIALSVKNKLGFINGRFKKPSKTIHPDEYYLWERANHMLISWFSHSVLLELVPNVLFAPSAQHVWEDFRARFSQGNLPRIFEIKQSIASHVQGAMTVANYFTKLRGYWDELDSYRPPCPCDCCKERECDEGIKRDAYHEEDCLMKFLMGLNDSYKSVRGIILLIKPIPDIREVYNMVTQEEKQREIGNSSLTENFSVVAATRTSKSLNSNRNSSFSKSNNGGLFCNYCKKHNHTIDTCYKLHGFPLGHPRYDPNFKPKSNRLHSTRQGQHVGQPSYHATHAATIDPTPMTSPGLHGPTTASTFANTNLQAICPGLSTEQYQQLTTAMANMTHLPKGNSDVYANAAGLGYEEDDWLG